MMRWFSLLFIVGAALALAAQPNQDDLKKLEGTWSAVSMEKGGIKLPDDTIKSITAVVKDGKLKIYFDDMLDDESTLKVDQTKKPKTIDATALAGENKGETRLAIYELDGDNFKICFAEPGKERPKDFIPKFGSGYTLEVWKRQKP